MRTQYFNDRLLLTPIRIRNDNIAIVDFGLSLCNCVLSRGLNRSGSFSFLMQIAISLLMLFYVTHASAGFSLSTAKPAAEEPVKAEKEEAPPSKDPAEILKRAEALKAQAEAGIAEAEAKAKAQKEAADSVLKRTEQLKKTARNPAVIPAGLSNPPVVNEPVAPPPVQFDTSKKDGTFREALRRWSSASGWDFFWQVERDIPIVGSAKFTSDFKQSVRQLLAATDGADIPLQPCFHTNNVLRVVRKSDDCKKIPNVPTITGDQ